MPVHLGLPILGIPFVHHGAVVEAQELRRPGVWQQEPHHLLIPRKYLQDHPSNALATGYAEIAQNSFTDAVMLGAREARAPHIQRSTLTAETTLIEMQVAQNMSLIMPRVSTAWSVTRGIY